MGHFFILTFKHPQAPKHVYGQIPDHTCIYIYIYVYITFCLSICFLYTYTYIYIYIQIPRSNDEFGMIEYGICSSGSLLVASLGTQNWGRLVLPTSTWATEAKRHCRSKLSLPDSIKPISQKGKSHKLRHIN